MLESVCATASDEPERYHPLPATGSERVLWGIQAPPGGIKKLPATLPRPPEQSRFNANRSFSDETA
jgi:hypothetical protein